MSPLLLLFLQVLGRNLEGVVNAAMGIKAKMHYLSFDLMRLLLL
jgi:hypothetical protein